MTSAERDGRPALRAIPVEARRDLIRLAYRGESHPDTAFGAIAYDWSHDARWRRLSNRLPGWLLPATGVALLAVFLIAGVTLRVPAVVTVTFGIACLAVVAIGLLGWLQTSLARTLRGVYRERPVTDP